MKAETFINIGYYASIFGFLVATVISATATDKFGKSTLGAVFTYLFIGTGILLVSTIFQKLGGSFFGISSESSDVWYYIMFFMAVFSYHYSYMAFIGLGSGTVDGTKGWEKRWGIFSLVLILAILFLSSIAEPAIRIFSSTQIVGHGFFPFLAFAFATIIGLHFRSVKQNLGKIGQAIAHPMFLALSALALEHLLMFINSLYGAPSPSGGQFVGTALLAMASICVIFAALRLKSVAKM